MREGHLSGRDVDRVVEAFLLEQGNGVAARVVLRPVEPGRLGTIAVELAVGAGDSRRFTEALPVAVLADVDALGLVTDIDVVVLVQPRCRLRPLARARSP
ncbi:hypothetical protein GCM10010431_20860 [Streptomyces kunmingensis]